MFVKALFRTLLTASILLVPNLLSPQSTPRQKGAEGVPYLNLTPPSTFYSMHRPGRVTNSRTPCAPSSSTAVDSATGAGMG